jgi:hypothetical protein
LIHLVGERDRQLRQGGDAREVRQLVPAPLGLQLRPLALGDVGAGDDGAAVLARERDRRDEEPGLPGRALASILEREFTPIATEHTQDARRGVAGLSGRGAGLPEGVEEIHADAEPRRWRSTGLAMGAQPSGVDVDDPAVSVQERDGAAERGEDRRLRLLACAQRLLRLLAREGAREDLGHEVEPPHDRPVPRSLFRRGRER